MEILDGLAGGFLKSAFMHIFLYLPVPLIRLKLIVPFSEAREIFWRKISNRRFYLFDGFNKKIIYSDIYVSRGRFFRNSTSMTSAYIPLMSMMPSSYTP